MRDIAIFGAGGFSKEIASLLERINQVEDTWHLIGFFDDNPQLLGQDVSRYGKVIGTIDALNSWQTPLSICIAIGNPHAIRNVRERITNPQISFPNIISPRIGYGDINSFKIGEGNIFLGGCWMSNDVTIGNFNLFDGEIVAGHDVHIGNYNVFMPGIRISGEVNIGNENLLGVGSIIIQQIKIGNNIHIGAGAVLMTKPKDGCTYIGNPAKLFKF